MSTFRADPEWQQARDELVREDGTAAEKWDRRVRAIPRMTAIEAKYLGEEVPLFDLPEVPFIEARSKVRFPSLAGPACPWHEACTPMDCENHRRLPESPWG